MAPWIITAAAVTLSLLLFVRLRASERQLAAARQAEGLEPRLAEELARAHRHGRALAVVAVGVDGVQAVNAVLGRRAADVVIDQVGGILRDAARGGDAVARVERGTFALLLPEQDRHGALAVAERLRGEVAGAFAVGMADVTLSLGVAEAAAGDSAAQLLHAADCALFLARELGGDRAVVFDDETAAALAELAAGAH